MIEIHINSCPLREDISIGELVHCEIVDELGVNREISDQIVMRTFQGDAVVATQRFVSPVHFQAYSLERAKSSYGKRFGGRSGDNSAVCINDCDIAHPTIADCVQIDAVVSRFLKNMASVVGPWKLNGQVLMPIS